MLYNAALSVVLACFSVSCPFHCAKNVVLASVLDTFGQPFRAKLANETGCFVLPSQDISPGGWSAGLRLVVAKTKLKRSADLR
jgi:hypothetical protein